MRLSKMRMTILLAMGFQVSCVTSGTFVDDNATDDDTGDTDIVNRTCDEVPLGSPANAREVELVSGEWLVCAPKSADTDCPTMADLEKPNETWRFLTANLGPTTDPDLCFWDGQVLCGPEEAIKDSCCYVFEVGFMCEGRPIRVEGAQAFSTVTRRSDWQEELHLDLSSLTDEQRQILGEVWQKAALAEHASVAAFGQFVLDLMVMGAPAALIEEAQQAMGDEIRHAKLCFQLASLCFDERVGPAAFPQAAKAEFSIENVLLGTILDGCINETLAASVALAEAANTKEPTLAAALQQLAEDEQRHAMLSWKTVQWILAEHPEYKELVANTFKRGIASHWEQMGKERPWAHNWGHLSGPARLQLVRQTLVEVVAPCAQQLLGGGMTAVVASTTQA